jgi:hypothetical protein
VEFDADGRAIPKAKGSRRSRVGLFSGRTATGMSVRVGEIFVGFK